MDTAAWFELEPNQPCGRCGWPLGRHRIWSYARDDFAPDVVEAARTGKINTITCGSCKADGQILSPFLWVDRLAQRAVFVNNEWLRPDKLDEERNRLLDLALSDLEPAKRERILLHLQEERIYAHIPVALAQSDLEAAHQRRASAGAVQRRGLPPQARLRKIVEDVQLNGSVAVVLHEITPHLMEHLRNRISLLGPDDDNRE